VLALAYASTEQSLDALGPGQQRVRQDLRVHHLDADEAAVSVEVEDQVVQRLALCLIREVRKRK
jgi:hypothetical protein